MRRAVLFAVLLLAACSSSTPVDTAPQLLAGAGGDVRVDAEIAVPPRAGEPIAIQYVITNERPAPITIADVLPQTTFDPETHTATVKIGVVASGSKPSLVRLAPGEKKSFRTVARLASAAAENRTLLRLQVNFADDGRPESVYTNAVPAYR